MEGFLGKDVAQMVNLCRQSIALYVARFNEGGLDHLLDRPFTRSSLATWSRAISDGRTTTGDQTTGMNHHSYGCRVGHFFIMEHTYIIILHPTNIWCFDVTGRYSEVVASSSLVMDTPD
ncbi:hypothetical protein [Anoxybacillus ayderensis]|uniref:hypothetical protein n=1 Tax=Anoxybacillus ayderensis TaxID=265546 RepID=UPI003B8A9085